MNLEFLERKDFWSGLMLIVIGGGAIFIARNYPFGSSLRMGPGYFPIVLGGRWSCSASTSSSRACAAAPRSSKARGRCAR